MDVYLKTLDRIYNLRGGVIDLRLDRMDRALELFGHPEKTFPSLHVAGTNGKGSTAAMLHRVLSQAGYRVGLYTSPHLVSFTERIRVGSEEILPEEVVELAKEIWDRTEAASPPLTFFEIVTAMAFIFFFPPPCRCRGSRSRLGREIGCYQPGAVRGLGDHNNL